MVNTKIFFLTLITGIMVFFALGLFTGLYFNNPTAKTPPLSPQPAQNAITDLIKTSKPDSASTFILYSGTLQSLTSDKVTFQDNRTIPLNFSLNTPVEFRAQVSSRSSVLTKKDAFIPGSKVSLFIGTDLLQNKINTVTLTLDQQSQK